MVIAESQGPLLIGFGISVNQVEIGGEISESCFLVFDQILGS